MLVNNETGVVQPIKEIAAMAHDVGALMHSDLAQAVGKLPWTVDSLAIDLGSLSAHKVHGPKGIGALYVRRGSCRVAEQQHGGHHERGMRSGHCRHIRSLAWVKPIELHGLRVILKLSG